MSRPAVPIPHSRIESIKQAPLNSNLWGCQLDCGHDEWITAKRRPTRQTMRCSRCVELSDEAAERYARDVGALRPGTKP